MRKLLAECIGTATLVILGCGTAMLVGCDAASGSGYLLTALAFGLTIVAMAYSIGNISGCHINPAVSLGVLLSGGMKLGEFVGYVISQIVGLEEIIRRRVGKTQIGFAAQEPGTLKREESLLPQVTAEDLYEFGMIPELVGRLPVLSTLDPLEEETLVRVLREPRNALVKQYKRLFMMEDAHIEFTEEALRALARQALERKTGARGLRSITETLLLDAMFQLPDQIKGCRYIITKEMVEGKEPVRPLPYSTLMNRIA